MGNVLIMGAIVTARNQEAETPVKAVFLREIINVQWSQRGVLAKNVGVVKALELVWKYVLLKTTANRPCIRSSNWAVLDILSL